VEPLIDLLRTDATAAPTACGRSASWDPGGGTLVPAGQVRGPEIKQEAMNASLALSRKVLPRRRGRS
jgi:hypothetical protein